MKEEALSFWLHQVAQARPFYSISYWLFLRKEKDMAVTVASSRIAATLFSGGRVAHSAFKLPLDLARSDIAARNISKGTGQGHVLNTCKLIVWCILKFSKTSRIMIGFLKEQFWLEEMMWLRSSMSTFRSSFQGKNMPTSP
ncbi:hypothetical protein TNCT_628011 [Trichonephila clavata]|uniref:ATP-dependent DNA helicase n=1 Tax=Trichonephila clavata TaxID=2740835 RepID=A0A8X6H9C6_TRICU|nr:hypothetical protein TNCT_628011 [Trichonephila clavata]